MSHRYQFGNDVVKDSVANLARDAAKARGYISGMATKPRQGREKRFYLAENMEDAGVSDTELAGRMGVSRTTVWRWRRQKRGVNTELAAQIAHHLQRLPEALWRRPGEPLSGDEPSIDAMISGEPPETRAFIREMVGRVIRKGT